MVLLSSRGRDWISGMTDRLSMEMRHIFTMFLCWKGTNKTVLTVWDPWATVLYNHNSSYEADGDTNFMLHVLCCVSEWHFQLESFKVCCKMNFSLQQCVLCVMPKSLTSWERKASCFILLYLFIASLQATLWNRWSSPKKTELLGCRCSICVHNSKGTLATFACHPLSYSRCCPSCTFYFPLETITFNCCLEVGKWFLFLCVV